MRYLSLSLLLLLFIPLIGLQEADAATWYDSNWLKARKITIDQTDIDADLTNYPLYVNMTSVNIGTDAQADCDDFVFTDSTNVTKLDHEIETCDSTADWAEFWVEVPTVTGASDTVIYMYYDNAGASDQQNTQATWNSNYKAVWHLNGTFIDSTSSPITCTNSGSSATSDEYIGDSREFDSVDDYLDCGSDAKIDNIWSGGGTYSAWLRPDTAGELNFGVVFSKSSSANVGWASYLNNPSGATEEIRFESKGTSTDGQWDSTNREINNSAWQLVTITYDSGSITNDPTFYVNGASVAITENSAPANIASDAGDDLCVGNSLLTSTACNTNITWDGRIDELRLDTTSESAAWIKADWECQRGAVDGNSCITVGAQGTEPVSASTVSNDFAIEDSASATLMGVVTVTDDFAIEDTATTTSGNTATVSDDFAIEDTAEGLAPGVANISDDFAIEDTVSSFSSTATVSDDFAIEDVTSSSVQDLTRNTIVLRVVKNPFEFRIYNDATRMTCEMSIQGGVIFNTQDLNLNICNGTMWILPDGSPT